MTALRFAAEQSERVSHLIVVGGFAARLSDSAEAAKAARGEFERMTTDWPAYLDEFFGTMCFSEPHSTKPYEDGVRNGASTRAPVLAMGMAGWRGNDLRELATKLRCPTLVIHGDEDGRVPYARGQEIASLIPHARLLTIGAGGHLMMARDPVAFGRAVHDFVGVRPPRSTWVRAMARKRRALFVSSAIGLGHVQRDLAIAREMRKLDPDLEIEWFTVHPASTYLEREGERLHPITARLANESRHFEAQAGEHDLHAFFALRTMDEVMARNFLTFAELLEQEHYDLVIGDEAWEVDYHYHENPELKRQPFVFLTDFVGCLPMQEGDEREAFLCADRNADDIEHVARYPWIRDRAIFVGNPEDVPDLPFGPGLPQIRDWTKRNFAFTGYALPFDPAQLADTDALRARHGYRTDEKLVIAAVGGTAVGAPLLRRIADAFPHMKRQVPELRMVLVAGPRVPRSALSGARRARGSPVRAQPVRAPRVLRPRARSGRPVDLHGAGRDPTPLPELSARTPFRAVHPRHAPAAQLLRRLRGALSRAHDRGARRAGACGDALAGRLQARRDRRGGASGAADPSGDGEPRMGIAMTPIDSA